MKDYLDYGIFYPVLSRKQIAACCNGMGAEWMPDWSREFLDYVFSVLGEAVDIHDVDFCHYMKADEWFHIANKRMERNMLAIVDRMPWYRYFAKRTLRKVCIPALFFAVENAGMAAFEAATIPEV